MTVTTTVSRWVYDGDGTAGPFAYTNKIFEASDLKVYVDGVLKTLGTHYTVSGVGNTNGGNVTFTGGNEPPAGDDNVVIVRDVPDTQETAYPVAGPFPSAAHEAALDRRTIVSQQIKTLLLRALLLDDTDPTAMLGRLPSQAARANKLLGFDADANPIASEGATSGVAVTPFMATVLDDADAAAVLTTLGLSAFVQSLLDGADASAFLTSLGFSTFIKTLIDDADAATARATLGAAEKSTLVDSGGTTRLAATLDGATITGNLIPEADNTRTLGSATASFAGIYLGGNGAEPLSEYDEGNWTPTLVGGTTPGSPTYGVQVGRYVRIGNLVHVQGRITISNKGGLAGAVSIRGLPFTSLNVANVFSAAALSVVDHVTYGANDRQLVGSIKQNEAQINLELSVTGAGITNLLDTDISDTFGTAFQASYRV